MVLLPVRDKLLHKNTIVVFIFAKSCGMPCSKIFADSIFRGLHHAQKYIPRCNLSLHIYGVTWECYTGKRAKRNDMAATYLCNSSIRGYHVYQSMWSTEERENLVCKRKMGNPLDSYAVIVVKGEQTVGHLPRKISRLCALFLGRGGSITATVTGRRRRSVDLPQGGLEIPCRLTFSGPEESITKVRSLMDKLNLLEDGGSCTKAKIWPAKKQQKVPSLLPVRRVQFGSALEDSRSVMKTKM